jgi:hypothetical protein
MEKFYDSSSEWACGNDVGFIADVHPISNPAGIEAAAYVISDNGVRTALASTDLEPARVFIIWRHWNGSTYDKRAAYAMESVPGTFYYRHIWPADVSGDLQNVQYIIRARRPPDDDPDFYNMSFWAPMEEHPHAWCVVPEDYDYAWTSALEP